MLDPMWGAGPHLDGRTAAQVRRGDSAAIEALYDRYGRLALGLAYRILNDRGAAEDAVQEAFVAVWRSAARFDANRGGLRNWLLSIVRNRAIDRLRGNAKARAEVQLDSTEHAGGVLDPWAAAALDPERSPIRAALSQPPAAQP